METCKLHMERPQQSPEATVLTAVPPHISLCSFKSLQRFDVALCLGDFALRRNKSTKQSQRISKDGVLLLNNDVLTLYCARGKVHILWWITNRNKAASDDWQSPSIVGTVDHLRAIWPPSLIVFLLYWLLMKFEVCIWMQNKILVFQGRIWI